MYNMFCNKYYVIICMLLSECKYIFKSNYMSILIYTLICISTILTSKWLVYYPLLSYDTYPIFCAIICDLSLIFLLKCINNNHIYMKNCQLVLYIIIVALRIMKDGTNGYLHSTLYLYLLSVFILNSILTILHYNNIYNEMYTIKYKYDNVVGKINEYQHYVNSHMNIVDAIQSIKEEKRQLMKQQKKNLMCYTYKDHQKECKICFSDYKDNDINCILSCNHIYHKECIIKWSQVKNICPTCNSSIIY